MNSGEDAGRVVTAGRSTERAFAAHEHTADREARRPTAGELAWLSALPCAVVVVAIIVVLGPPLGRLLFPHDALTFIPAVRERIPPLPEPTEQARFLLALTAPLLLTACIALGMRRATPLRADTIARLVRAGQIVAFAFVVTCCVVQRWYRFQIIETAEHTVYFTVGTLAVAAVLAVGLGVAAASTRVRGGFARWTRDTRTRRVVGSGIALVAVVVWLLPAINFDGTIGNAHEAIAEHIVFWIDETFSVLAGAPPLVGYAAQYGSLWPYPVAGAMAIFGASLGVYTIATAAISGLAMLGVFAALRRVVRSTLVAVMLFLPVLATGFFMMEGPLANRYAMDNLFGTFPMRYAGPLLVMWLVARHLDGGTPRRVGWLFLAGGLAVLNNADFGVPALGATFAALLWAAGRMTLRVLLRLLFECVIGLLGAFALVAVLTLVTADSLPHLSLLFRFSRLFAISGWGMLPMTPIVGMSTVIYLTYVAAIGLATVRAVNRDPDRLLTGLLAWSGVFGLGIGSYYMGRSHPEVLTNMFAAWALAVALLLVVCMRSLTARASHRPTLAEAACLFAFGVLVCSLAQTPTPWSQTARLRHTAFSVYAKPPGQRFIAARTHAGEHVALLAALGHRTAYNLGLVDVNPNAGGGALVTFEQVEETLDRLQRTGGHKVFLSSQQGWPELIDVLQHRGYFSMGEESGMLEYASQR
ncbi:MAG TPA: hypothetical protein VGO48_07950 [Conexibacter sp.]|nr:hypothetical protein [Conexibacter sp.]